jgi:RNA polymerase sigma factor (sigma-70 family)
MTVSGALHRLDPRIASEGPRASTALAEPALGPWSDMDGLGTLGRVAAEAGEARVVPGAVESDRVLAARLIARESEALAEAYRQYAGLVLGMCRRVLHDETLAEDATQEVFAFLWRFPDRFDPSRGSLRTWLGLLAHRRSVDRVRSENRRIRKEEQFDVPAPAVSDVENLVTATWLSDRVRHALERLPSEQREAVVLAYYGDRSYRQVAMELGIPEGTVKSRVRLALRRLDTLLRSELSDQDNMAWN